MEPSVTVTDPGLAEVRRRRMSLREALNRLEHALALPAPTRSHLWSDQVGRAADEVALDLREHVEKTEGPSGFHADIVTAAPRLAHAVGALTADHVTAVAQVNKIVTDARTVATTQDVDQLRELGTALIALLSRHRQRGADLIYEAYEFDIGGED